MTSPFSAGARSSSNSAFSLAKRAASVGGASTAVPGGTSSGTTAVSATPSEATLSLAALAVIGLPAVSWKAP